MTAPQIITKPLLVPSILDGTEHSTQLAMEKQSAATEAPKDAPTIITDNGIQFCDLPKNRLGPTASVLDLLCRANRIEHRLTKLNHPWTNGKVERMNRTLKEATVRRYYYDSHDQLRQHLAAFLDAYNFAKRLKTLKGLTPFESIWKAWTNKPDRFQLTSGLLARGLPNGSGGLGRAAQILEP